jgi:hypothetical protein
MFIDYMIFFCIKPVVFRLEEADFSFLNQKKNYKICFFILFSMVPYERGCVNKVRKARKVDQFFVKHGADMGYMKFEI